MSYNVMHSVTFSMCPYIYSLADRRQSWQNIVRWSCFIGALYLLNGYVLLHRVKLLI